MFWEITFDSFLFCWCCCWIVFIYIIVVVVFSFWFKFCRNIKDNLLPLQLFQFSFSCYWDYTCLSWILFLIQRYVFDNPFVIESIFFLILHICYLILQPLISVDLAEPFPFYKILSPECFAFHANIVFLRTHVWSARSGFEPIRYTWGFLFLYFIIIVSINSNYNF